MTLKEIQESEWYKKRPKVIQEAINKLPPIHPYKFKDSGKQCIIRSYEEHKSGKLEDVTCTVVKTGIGGVMAESGLGVFDKDIGVFGVSLDDLEAWED